MRDPKNYLIIALVAVVAFLAGTTAKRGEALGQGYPGGVSDSNNRMIAVTGTIGSGVSVLWIIDSLDHQIAVYQCRGGKSVELVAARNIEWDLKIDYLNDESRYRPEQLRELFLKQPGRGTKGIRDPDDEPEVPDGEETPGTGKEGE